MPSPVTSGLGRNGPWLQNRWLRVETRQDNGAISPVALEGAFRPAERALAYVQPRDGPALSLDRCDYDVRPYDDELGKGRLLTLTAREPRRRMALRREVVLYDAHPFCVIRLGVTNEGAAPSPLSSLHVFTTPGKGRGRIQLTGKPAQWRIYRHGWQSWAPTMSLGGAQRDLRDAPPTLAPEPPETEHGRFACDDVGMLYDPASSRSFLAGAVTARDLVTQVFIDAPARSIDVRCLADGLALAPGETVWSERIAIDLAGVPNVQLERYGDTLGLLMRARVPTTTPAGWCSWYYFFTEVTEGDVIRNLRFLERHRRELPIDTVQIDDGYQADIGDWLQANEKFSRGMGWLASLIKEAGYRPGLWLAPFLLAESSRTYAQYPEWVVRGDDGEPIVAQRNWQRNNFGIDGSHPGAQAWLTDLFREVCEGWGYDYVKIDFLFGAAIAGRRHEPGATRVRAYRAALDAVRRGVGSRRFILGCGALMAPSVGVFDGNRIGPDVAPWWRFLTSEERAHAKQRPRTPDDGLSAETAIRNTLNRSWMHRRLWLNDPDCLLVRTDRTKLSLDETRTLAAVIGLSGGMVLSSDDLENVPRERLEIMSMLLPPLLDAATPVDLMLRDMPERYEATIERDDDPSRVVALFNFADEQRDLSLPLPEGGPWHAVELWDGRYLGCVSGALRFRLVAAHACKLVILRPQRDTPWLVASTAHVSGGALDVSSIAYDAAARALRLALAPVGRRTRRVFFSTGGMDPIRAELDGAEAPIDGGGEVRGIEAAVGAPATLEVVFRGST